MADHAVLERFSPAVREWFATSFPEPTPAQVQGWPAIAAGEHTLICAPTGSGKTLAAFLWGIDRLVTHAAARGKAAHPAPLHLAAAGPRVRRREEPAGPAGRHRAWPPSGSGVPFTEPIGRHAHRRHAAPRTARRSSATRPTC